MDDLYLICDDSKRLTYCKAAIAEKLKEVGLRMNENKTTITRIHPLRKGEPKKTPVKYLKWNFYITVTGHIIMLPFRSKIAQQKRKLRKMQVLWLENKISTEELQ